MKRLLLALAAGAAIAGTAAPASAVTCTFQGPGSDWHTAANWSCMAVPAVPTAVDDVVIPFPEAVFVSTADAAANSIDLDSGADLIVVDGRALSLTGGGPSSFAGTVELRDENSVLRLAGVTGWTAGDWRVDGTVENTGALTVAGNLTASAWNLGTGRFRNGVFGVISRTNGIGNTELELRLDNAGSIVVQSGRLTLAGGGTHSGAFTVADSAMLVLDGSHAFSATTLLTGAGTYIQRGGATTLTNAVVSAGGFDVQGGVLTAVGSWRRT